MGVGFQGETYLLGAMTKIMFFNEIEHKKGRTYKMQPLWISKDPGITEEREKLSSERVVA